MLNFKSDFLFVFAIIFTLNVQYTYLKPNDVVIAKVKLKNNHRIYLYVLIFNSLPPSTIQVEGSKITQS